jgi:NAD(P)-dependent dehydrogenase (short-subunit alcohol dehydrogenase family)
MLKNKVIIVAGSAGLLGRAFARSLLNNDATVILADINEKLLLEFYNELKGENFSEVEHYKLDITSKDSIQSLISQIKSKHKKIDGFVNTAYPRNNNWGVPVEDVKYDDFCENVNLHLGGYFLCTQQFAIFFKSQGFGKIVNISSILGVSAPKFDTYKGIFINGKEMSTPVEYSAIKSGIIHFSKYFAKYYHGCNITINCISPGGLYVNQPQEFVERYRKYCNKKGMLAPNDITGTLIYLLSEFGDYVNGQNLIVDDGWSL